MLFLWGLADTILTINGMHSYVLNFPEPVVIYLYYEGVVPDEYMIKLNFGTQGSFVYKVKTFKFLDVSVTELNQRKMIIWIPFQLLKLRKLLEKECSKENLESLKNGSIIENLRLGNITEDDALRLKRLAYRLYTYFYSHYEEMEVLNDMTDESLMLDIDIIEKQHEAEKAAIIAEKDERIALLQARLKELEEINKVLSGNR